jgi:phosphoribosyl-AMP cyclohydrolase
MRKFFEILKFNDQGLIPTTIADYKSGRPLTLCYMNRDALEKTLETGKIHVFRRSKGRLMIKGETSGHIEIVRETRVDCEGNSLLFLVDQKVAACHAGYFSCYYRRYSADKDLWETTDERVFDPEKVY